MKEREIIDDGNSGIAQIKCSHCNGTGKCDCFNCYKYTYDKTASIDEYKSDMEDEVLFCCSKCNGYGFLLLKPDGTIIVPKPEEE